MHDGYWKGTMVGLALALGGCMGSGDTTGGATTPGSNGDGGTGTEEGGAPPSGGGEDTAGGDENGGAATGGDESAGEATGGGCDPGETRTCVGPGQCPGAQFCEDDGGWSACDCGSGTGGAVGSGGTSGTGGSEPLGGAAGAAAGGQSPSGGTGGVQIPEGGAGAASGGDEPVGGSGGTPPVTGGSEGLGGAVGGTGGTVTTCGNGEIEAGEDCDLGASNGLVYEDGSGCTATCTAPPQCRPAGVTQACAAACGDGVHDASEGCDDGNRADGDGCSATCAVEAGFSCTDQEMGNGRPCPSNPELDCLVLGVTYRDFDGQDAATGHPDFFYLTAPGTEGTPGVLAGATITTCVPNASGTRLPYDGYCPSNDAAGACPGLVATTLNAQGKPSLAANTCPCIHTDWDETGILEGLADVEQCMVEGSAELRDRIEATVPVMQSAESFAQWYEDSTFSTEVRGTLELAATGGGQFTFSSREPGQLAGAGGRTLADDLHAIFMGTQTTLTSGFYPLEDQPRPKICNLWPYWVAGTTADTCRAGAGYSIESQWDSLGSYDPGLPGTGGPVEGVIGMLRNFYFTTEIHHTFRYGGVPGTLSFTGDDDAWVFVNGRLVIDLGGPHTRATSSVTLDESLGLATGNVYEIAIFHADRHPRESNFQLTLPDFTAPRSVCTPL